MSGGGPSSQTVTQKTELPGWVQDAAAMNIGRAQDLSNQPYTPYTGPEVAPLNADQQAALAALRSVPGSTVAPFSTAMGSVLDLPGTTQSLLNPYLGSVESDVVSNMQRANAMNKQAINDNAAAVHAFGGDRTAISNAIADSETQRNIGQAVNTISSQGYNTALNAALQRASTIGNLASAGQTAAITGAQAGLTGGTLEQTQQQGEYANALANWQAAQNYPYQQLAVAQSALSGTPYGATVMAQQPYNSNPLASGIGLAASAIPAAYLGYKGISSLLGGSGFSALTDAATPAALGYTSGAGGALTGTIGTGLDYTTGAGIGGATFGDIGAGSTAALTSAGSSAGFLDALASSPELFALAAA